VPDRDVLTDFIPLRYDTGKVTPEQILETIRKQGFEATIVSNPKATAPDKPPAGVGAP